MYSLVGQTEPKILTNRLDIFFSTNPKWKTLTRNVFFFSAATDKLQNPIYSRICGTQVFPQGPALEEDNNLAL